VNNYLIFGGWGEPVGGWMDFLEAAYDLPEAENLLAEHQVNHKLSWWEIVDVHSLEIVSHG